MALDYELSAVTVRDYEAGTRWPGRIIEELGYAIKTGVCTAEEAKPWLRWARSEKARLGRVTPDRLGFKKDLGPLWETWR